MKRHTKHTFTLAAILLLMNGCTTILNLALDVRECRTDGCSRNAESNSPYCAFHEPPRARPSSYAR